MKTRIQVIQVYITQISVYAIVKAKHRFLVQHASYSLERAVNCHFVTL